MYSFQYYIYRLKRSGLRSLGIWSQLLLHGPSCHWHRFIHKAFISKSFGSTPFSYNGVADIVSQQLRLLLSAFSKSGNSQTSLHLIVKHSSNFANLKRLGSDTSHIWIYRSISWNKMGFVISIRWILSSSLLCWWTRCFLQNFSGLLIGNSSLVFAPMKNFQIIFVPFVLKTSMNWAIWARSIGSKHWGRWCHSHL